mmetsp:Transcript_36112/g.55461  ORF Transcript_36112/g.55461 Transcript_36112/m.55461 type:complete len:225 (+) Transcript_36112:318-992(+)
MLSFSMGALGHLHHFIVSFTSSRFHRLTDLSGLGNRGRDDGGLDLNHSAFAGDRGTHHFSSHGLFGLGVHRFFLLMRTNSILNRLLFLMIAVVVKLVEVVGYGLVLRLTKGVHELVGQEVVEQILVDRPAFRGRSLGHHNRQFCKNLCSQVIESLLGLGRVVRLAGVAVETGSGIRGAPSVWRGALKNPSNFLFVHVAGVGNSLFFDWIKLGRESHCVHRWEAR